MHHRPAAFPRFLLPALALLALLAAGLSRAREEASWWKDAGDPTTDALTGILGSSPAGWQFNDKGTIVEIEGLKALAPSGEQPLILTSSTLYGTNLEYTLSFRLTAPPDKAGSMYFQIGITNTASPTGSSPGIYFGSSPGAPYIHTYIYGPTGTYHNVSYYYPKGHTTRSLGWPETLRKSVERDLASLPGPNEIPFTYRFVVRNGSVETWFNDRFQGLRSKDNPNVAGHARITINPGLALTSFRVRPIPAQQPLMRPMPIDGIVNASSLNGARMDHSHSMPPPGETVRVHDVPFIFATPDSRGRDHLSIAPSWAQFSALEAYVESHVGEFGGRWTTCFSANPARIQTRIPYDNYTKLHLIAASDDTENSVPVISAQFFRAASGFPKSFSTRVPLFSKRATDVEALPVRLENGREGALYHVTIPLDPGQLSDFSGDEAIEVELTKEVKHYRAYPDPICFSFHQGGLPSSVHVYAMTLERSPVGMEFNPDKFGHVWTAPLKPSYTATLRNRTSAPRTVEMDLDTVSLDGTSKTTQKQSVTIPPGNVETPVKFALNDLKRFGYHDVTLTMKDGDQTWVEKRSLAHLAPDTRERGNWDEGRGALFGIFDWGGGHTTPKRMDALQVMGEAGAETTLGSFEGSPPEQRALAEKFGMISVFLFDAATIYYNAFVFSPMKEKYDPAKPAESGAALVEFLKTIETKPSAITRPIEVPFFPEPGLGPISWGNQPDYYGEPEHVLSDDEEKNYQMYLTKFLIGAKAIRKQWPNAKLMLPHGDPLFCIPFIRRNAEVRELIDGVALDMPGFERMPESQLHQVVQHRLYELVNEFKKIGKVPRLTMHEGTCADTPPGALTFEEQADIYTRNFLSFFAYGVTRHPSGPSSFDCGNYWGEEHYGCCGLFTRVPYCNPKPSYVAYATLTRHLNRANFEKWLPTGSLSTYCHQYKHSKTNKLIHVFWCIRGQRPVTLTVPKGAKISHFDEDDNLTELVETDGKVTFPINSSPCYVEGLDADAQISLGEPDHSDSKPGPITVKLDNLADGWEISKERDDHYENSYYLQIARFPGKMSAAPEDAPAQYGGKALAVRLGQQDKERKVMPWYTTLVPRHDITIPGRSSHLGLWVKAASDWGRVVYCLKDAKGEKWLSIGTAENWNCDDTHLWSYFNFDGWRYLKFEMPSNAPYDSFRELGSTWWGHFGKGDGVVDLPLKLDKIMVERRTHAMYVNDPQPTRPDDVLLGDLYAEYETASDKTDEVVRLSRVRMPMPEGVPDVGNPIKDLESKGVGAPTVITKTELPLHQYDGTRCHVFFDKVAGATGYNLWVSPYENGNGAIEMAKDWKEPGQLLTGLRPEVDFHIFVVYTDKDGKVSKPSKPFKIRLRDMFGMK